MMSVSNPQRRRMSSPKQHTERLIENSSKTVRPSESDAETQLDHISFDETSPLVTKRYDAFHFRSYYRSARRRS
jgi:hypothetical protein